MQRVVFLPIVVVCVRVWVCVHVCACVCLFMYTPSWWTTGKRLEINQLFFYHFVGHKKAIQWRIQRCCSWWPWPKLWRSDSNRDHLDRLNVIISQGKETITIVNIYEVAYGLSIDIFTFDLGQFSSWMSRSCKCRLNVSQMITNRATITNTTKKKQSYIGFRLAYLNLTLAHCKD